VTIKEHKQELVPQEPFLTDLSGIETRVIAASMASKSKLLRKGMALGLSRQVLGIAERAAEGPTKFRDATEAGVRQAMVTVAPPKLNRRQRRAAKK
jgi:putative ubiquitin-RnfH superfamily antitoxin RatB of RatAB toxin-antitoxin module